MMIKLTIRVESTMIRKALMTLGLISAVTYGYAKPVKLTAYQKTSLANGSIILTPVANKQVYAAIFPYSFPTAQSTIDIKPKSTTNLDGFYDTDSNGSFTVEVDGDLNAIQAYLAKDNVIEASCRSIATPINNGDIVLGSPGSICPPLYEQ